MTNSSEWGRNSEKSFQMVAEKPSHVVQVLIKKYAPEKSEMILDIGCGEGRNFKYLLEKGYSMHGLDIADIPGLREFTQPAPDGTQFGVGDIRSMIPITHHNFYSTVIMSRVAQYLSVDELRMLLEKIYFMTKEGGYLCLSYTAKGGILDDPKITYKFSHSIEDIRTYLGSNGFEIIEEHPYLGYSSNHNFASRPILTYDIIARVLPLPEERLKEIEEVNKLRKLNVQKK